MRPQLGCYGDKVVKSPNLDALAARGMVFQRAFCQQALCSPSRISLLSGRHVWTTKIYEIGPPLRSTMPDIVTLPQHFKNHGWHTQSLGKIFHIGIDDPISWSAPSWVSKAQRYDPDNAAKVKAAADKFRAAGQPVPKQGPNLPMFAGPAFSSPDCADDALVDGDITLKAIAELRDYANKPDQPFFLGVGFINPHVPWVAPKRYYDLYRHEDIKLPANRYVPKNAPKYAATSGDDFYRYNNVPRDRVISEEFGRQCLHCYLAAISYVDACIGRLLAELDRLGLRENTIIVYWSDHGYYMGEHNWWGGKHNNYEGATHAPLLVAAPGMKAAGQGTRALVEFVDIFPSLAELAGLPQPAGLEGKSFAPLLDRPDLPWKAAAFSEYPKGGKLGTAMRTDRYRYVEWREKNGALADRELYDHETDPQENENIAGKPEHAALLEQLAAQMKAAKPGQ
jgi:arylsulfatase A-like enzyme